MKNKTFSNGEQLYILNKYFMKVLEYPEYDEVQEVKRKIHNENKLINNDIETLILFASYVGALIRIAYYKYVYKRGFDIRILADACVKTFLFNGIYQFELEPYLKNHKVKKIINRTRFPKWTKIGITGGSIKEINELGKEFAKYMDGLNG